MLAAERVTDLTDTIKRLAGSASAIVAFKSALIHAGMSEERAHSCTLAMLTGVLAIPSQPELPQPAGGE